MCWSSITAAEWHWSNEGCLLYLWVWGVLTSVLAVRYRDIESNEPNLDRSQCVLPAERETCRCLTNLNQDEKKKKKNHGFACIFLSQLNLPNKILSWNGLLSVTGSFVKKLSVNSANSLPPHLNDTSQGMKRGKLHTLSSSRYLSWSVFSPPSLGLALHPIRLWGWVEFNQTHPPPTVKYERV